jgi:hypothetical protein
MKKFDVKATGGSKILILIMFCVSLSLKSQTKPDGSAPQFLFPEFSTGMVKMKNGTIQSTLLNYNIVSEKMVYEKDGNLYDITNSPMIDTVYLQERKFVPVGEVFHEVLVVNRISLFVQHKGELLPPGAPGGYGTTSQVSNSKLMTSVQLQGGYYNLKLPEDYIVKPDPVYWIRNDNAMYSFLNERQFLKLFPDSESDLKQFIKQNKIKFYNLSDLCRLIEYCNEMKK